MRDSIESGNTNISHLYIDGLFMKLSQLQQGQKATIKGFSELSNDVRKKLMVMGLLPNTQITLIRKAPMGDPLQVEVRGVSLAVRAKIADAIAVEME
jgi:ferrous iron transport protein A